MNADELRKEPDERTFQLKCKVVVKEISVVDDDRKFTRRVVLLVPEDNDQRSMFLATWLPDTAEQHYELVGFVKSPIDSPARLSVHRRNQRHDNHHLFMMSKGVEEIILENRLEGKFLDVTILPASMDEAADDMKDTGNEHRIRF